MILPGRQSMSEDSEPDSTPLVEAVHWLLSGDMAELWDEEGEHEHGLCLLACRHEELTTHEQRLPTSTDVIHYECVATGVGCARYTSTVLE